MCLTEASFGRCGERIRDKIAASKKKGLWMGGNPPLGYDARGRALVVNPGEAATIRQIFTLYEQLGCVRRVKEEADRLGLRTKRSMSRGGTERGGKPFSRGHLYSVLFRPAGSIGHNRAHRPSTRPTRAARCSPSTIGR
jgi:site-specific DNA recombinase